LHFSGRASETIAISSRRSTLSERGSSVSALLTMTSGLEPDASCAWGAMEIDIVFLCFVKVNPRKYAPSPR
jgi:hypothetical protein